MRVLVTGARGLVGSNIVKHARSAEHDVLAPARGELDLCDHAAVTAWLGAHEVDMVVHCAGRVGGILANMTQPVDFLVQNLDMGRNIVLAARAAGIRRVLNLSSSCIYPRGVEGELSEDMILTGELEPTNEGYALAKIATLRLCQYVSREDVSLRYKTLIPCNIYGPGDAFDPVRAHLVPAAIMKVDTALRTGQRSVEIWGDGRARREFMYVGDLADLIWEAVGRFDELPDLMNVGLGHDHTIDEYYDAVSDTLGWDGEFVHDLDRPSGMRRKLVDVRRQTAFGWRAMTSLRDGIARTHAYYASLDHDTHQESV